MSALIALLDAPAESGRAAVGNVAQSFSLLARYADRPLIDETGLAGNYEHPNLELNNFAQLRKEDPVGAQVALGSALRDRLGLQLEPRVQRTEILVIDRVAEPSAN